MLPYLISGLTLGLAAGLSPGPLLAFLVTQTVRHGLREGWKVALAPLLSDSPIVAATLVAVGRLSASNLMLALISGAGGLYLIWLGIESATAREVRVSGAPSSPHSIRRSVAINFLNPHVYVFWSAVGAPATLLAYETRPAWAVTFLAAFYVALCGSKIVLAALIHRSRGVLAGLRYQRTLRLLGLLLVCLGVWLLWEGVRFATRTGPPQATHRTAEPACSTGTGPGADSTAFAPGRGTC
jgi:threonine/homoserine/homoserine lactone efflux protein